ncbi:GNAT family N-acetyltransferase [Candidatus Acetothermia bacterium]|nr:GNAT family N-acetyltransferase [Candidatus Acetothermia bacterium]
MLNTAVKIKTFDRLKASESEYVAWNNFTNRIQAEQWPEDPPVKLEQTVRNLRFIPPFRDMTFWAVWSGDQIVARASIGIMRTEDNQHLADFYIAVLPEMRCQGIAKHLLHEVANIARKENRRLLQTHTDSAISAGEIAIKRLGGRMGIASHTNQLNVSELDRNLIHSWQERAKERAQEFELGFWEGPFPEEELDAIIELIEVMNTEPRENLEMEDWHLTPERVRQEEESMAKRQTERWMMYVRDRKTREFAGFTEVYWNPMDPEKVQQGGTGVLPKYRNKGLGRWLKAAMLEKVLRERPQVKRLRTGNANSNGPMLKINHELGFKPYKSWIDWQVELDKVLEYLKRDDARS